MHDRPPRKLTAIVYADVAGYSRLTGEDEEGTHRRLSEHPDLISDAIKEHQGRVVHFAGFFDTSVSGRDPDQHCAVVLSASLFAVGI